MPVIAYLPKPQPIDSSSSLMAGAKAFYYITNTSTPKDTYADFALTTPNTNPVIADGNGVFQTVFLKQDVRYRLTLKTSADVLIYTQDDIAGPSMSQAEIGLQLYPQTAAEIAAGVTPTNYAYPPGDVHRYGGLDDDSTANDTPIANAVLQARQTGGAEVQFVKRSTGNFKFTSTLEFGYTRLRIRGIGKVYLKHTGTGVAVSVNASPSGAIYDLRIENLDVTGNANTTYAWDIAKIGRSYFDIRARNCTTGLRTRLAVVCEIHFTCSNNELAFTTTPVTGAQFAVYSPDGTGATTTDCNIWCTVEGVSGNGVELRGCAGCNFHGTSEGNTLLGLSIDTTANNNYNNFIAFDMESNLTGDVSDAGINNTYINCTASTRAAGAPFDSVPSYLFVSGARSNLVVGGFCYSAKVNSGAEAIVFWCANIEDDVNDAGTNTSIFGRQGTVSSAVKGAQLYVQDAFTAVPALQGTWTYPSGTYFAPSYAYDRSKREVILRGQVGTGTLGTVITTMPAGFRPSKRCVFVVPATAGGATALIEARADGSIQHLSGDVTAIELSTVRYFTS